MLTPQVLPTRTFSVKRLRLLVDRPGQHVEGLDLGPRGRREVGDRRGLQALVGRAAVRAGRRRRGQSPPRPQTTSVSAATAAITRRVAVPACRNCGCQGIRSMVSSSVVDSPPCTVSQLSETPSRAATGVRTPWALSSITSARIDVADTGSAPAYAILMDEDVPWLLHRKTGVAGEERDECLVLRGFDAPHGDRPRAAPLPHAPPEPGQELRVGGVPTVQLDEAPRDTPRSRHRRRGARARAERRPSRDALAAAPWGRRRTSAPDEATPGRRRHGGARPIEELDAVAHRRDPTSLRGQGRSSRSRRGETRGRRPRPRSRRSRGSSARG